MTETSPPVATVGMHGSASTWVYNVARELITAAAGELGVRAVYADVVGGALANPGPPGARLLIKSHQGSRALEQWFSETGATLILSLRDPRDATLSMASRFGVPLAHAIEGVAADCRRLKRLAPQAGLSLRYEERFFDRPETIERIADVLRLAPPPETLGRIFSRYRTEAVRTFAQTLSTLPPERVERMGTHVYDNVTHIHGPHIGDTRSGKWRDLPIEQRAEMTRRFRPYLKEFSYPEE